jgi:hypothetical protein
MIQRIQTLYLSIATALSIIMLQGPMVKLVGQDGQLYLLKWNGIMEQVNGDIFTILEKVLPLSILMILVPVFLVISILLFKRRKLQIRITVLSSLLLLGILLLQLYYAWYAGNKLAADFTFNIKMTFPLVGSILGYLAFRAILKDELLVKSYDRIR